MSARCAAVGPGALAVLMLMAVACRAQGTDTAQVVRVLDTINARPGEIPALAVMPRADLPPVRAVRATHRPRRDGAFHHAPGFTPGSPGYDWRITKQGTGRIHRSDTVTVQVKESLADGTVIKDMANTGSVLTQPVAKFPPLFASALLKMQNKGRLSMVVPPALAYGDKGLPPAIPPRATLRYDIAVLEVRAK